MVCRCNNGLPILEQLQSAITLLSDGIDTILAQDNPNGDVPASRGASLREHIDDDFGALDHVAGLLVVDGVEGLSDLPDRCVAVVVNDLCGLDARTHVEEPRAEVPRFNDGAGDSERFELFIQRLGDAGARPLRGGVVGVCGAAGPGAQGPEVGDDAGALGAHGGENGAGDVDHTKDVGCKFGEGFFGAVLTVLG